jgi:hypothetical protein
MPADRSLPVRRAGPAMRLLYNNVAELRLFHGVIKPIPVVQYESAVGSYPLVRIT